MADFVRGALAVDAPFHLFTAPPRQVRHAPSSAPAHAQQVLDMASVLGEAGLVPNAVIRFGSDAVPAPFLSATMLQSVHSIAEVAFRPCSRPSCDAGRWAGGACPAPRQRRVSASIVVAATADSA